VSGAADKASAKLALAVERRDELARIEAGGSGMAIGTMASSFLVETTARFLPPPNVWSLRRVAIRTSSLGLDQ
jgi:hypothetical protein